MEYVQLYTPGNEGESSFIESLLSAHNIHYFIQNEIGSRYVIGGLSYATFYVHPKDLQLAQKILDEKTGRNPKPAGNIQQAKTHPNNSESLVLKSKKLLLILLRLIFGK